jgi:hypothetical protein
MRRSYPHIAQRNNPYSFIAYDGVRFVSYSCTRFSPPPPNVRSSSSSSLLLRLLVLSNQLLNSSNVLLLRIRSAQVLDLSPLVVLSLALQITRRSASNLSYHRIILIRHSRMRQRRLTLRSNMPGLGASSNLVSPLPCLKRA